MKGSKATCVAGLGVRVQEMDESHRGSHWYIHASSDRTHVPRPVRAPRRGSAPSPRSAPGTPAPGRSPGSAGSAPVGGAVGDGGGVSQPGGNESESASRLAVGQAPRPQTRTATHLQDQVAEGAQPLVRREDARRGLHELHGLAVVLAAHAAARGGEDGKQRVVALHHPCPTTASGRRRRRIHACLWVFIHVGCVG